MAISAQELSARYPRLYHMATYGAWPSIQKHGLLSSAALCELFAVEEPRRSRLLEQKRQAGERLSLQPHDAVTLRDQKPLSEKKLQRCLIDCDPPTWFRMLTERVFFWLSCRRLMTLMSAAEYRGKPHTILQIDTAMLLGSYENQVELAPINTGATDPFAVPRGKHTFQSLRTYPYEARRSKGCHYAVVELTVPHGVIDLRRYVRKVEHAAVKDGRYCVEEILLDDAAAGNAGSLRD